MNVHLVLHELRNLGQDVIASIIWDCRTTLRGVAMGLSPVGLPTRTKVDPAVRRPLDLTARLQCAPGRPRVVRMPSDWWDSPAVAACPLGAGAQSGRAARKFTRNTLREWGLASLADDAEAIVGEFVANAVSHAARSAASGQPLGLRLLRRTGEVMCAVLDPSDIAPVLRMPDRNEEAGRGLQMVDALSDVWGWSPVTGRGKAVWAILFCALSVPLTLAWPPRASPRRAARRSSLGAVALASRRPRP
jgi:anti-sigma regulatory factor (Ser/Thr protein kinase)